MHNFIPPINLRIKLYAICWFIALIAVPNILLAQKHGQARVDSLIANVTRARQDTNMVNSLIDLSAMYKDINPKQGIVYGENALALATKLKWQKGIGFSYYNLGQSYPDKADENKAQQYYKKAEAIADQSHIYALKFKILNAYGKPYLSKGDLSYTLKIFGGYVDLGLKIRDPEAFNAGAQLYYSALINRKKYTEALAYFNALEVRTNKPGLEVYHAYATQFIGDVLFSQTKFKEGIVYFEKALKILDVRDNDGARGRIIQDIADAYLNTKDTVTAFKYYTPALKLYQKAGLIVDQQTIAGNIVMAIIQQRNTAVVEKNTDLLVQASLANEDYASIANAYFSLSYFFMIGNDQQRVSVYTDKLIKLAKESGSNRVAGICYYDLASLFNDQKKYTEALAYNQQAINYFQQVNLLLNIRNAYVQRANVQLTLKNYTDALGTLQKEIATAKKMDDKVGLAAADLYMGDVYNDINDRTNALKYYEDGRKLYVEAASYGGIINAYYDIASLYNKFDYDKAIENGLAGLKIAQDYNYRNYLGTMPNIVAIGYYNKGNYDEAMKYAMQSNDVPEIFFDKAPTYISLSKIIRVAPDDVLVKYGIKPTERYQKSLEYLNQSNLSNQAFKLMDNYRDYWEGMSTTYARLNDYNKAYDAYKKYIDYRDSTQANSNRVDFVQKQMEFDYNKRADSINFQQRLTSEKLKQQTLLATQQRQSLLLNQQQFSLVKKEKDLQQLGYLKTQAELQAEQNRRKVNDQKLKTAQKEQALTEANFQLQKAELGSKRTQNRFFIGGLIALVILSFFIGLNYYNQRKSNLVIVAANKQTDIQREAAESRLADLTAAQNQLIQSEKMASLGELTAGIAHEIQNPLNFVNNFSEVSIELLDEMQEELNNGHPEEAMAIAADLKNNLQKIGTHGKRADFIVKGMLQHSRTNKGERQPTNVNMLADEFFKLSYHGLRAKDKSFNAELLTNFDDNLPKVNVVQQDVGRVLLNLFNNAFYAVQQKQKTAGADYKPTVEVSTTTLKNNVVITVKDNGVGIPDNIREKIMQPFFTTKPTGQGTGLGLSLSYDIVVKGHGGEIKIDSEEGEYTIFNIILPV